MRERTQTIFGMLDNVPQHEERQEEQCLGSICDPWKVNNRTPSPPLPPTLPSPLKTPSNRGPGRVQATLELSGEDSRPYGGSASERGEKKDRRQGAGGGGGKVLGAGCQQLADRMCSHACVKWVGGLRGEL